MKKFCTTVLLAIVMGATLQSQTAPDAFEMNERLGRGINMGNAFEAPDEDAWGNPWQPEYFKMMAELGFDHVRIPIRWDTHQRTLQEPPYTIYPTFLERIKEVVDTALQNGLHPIINMHHHDAIFIDPLGEKEKFLAQWEQIADFFKDYPDSLVFEVLNEPHNNLTPELWNEFFAEALEIIRETNPTRAVLLGTPLFGGLSGVPYLEIPDDPYIILSVHYYNPFEFTHQGAEWVGGDSDAWLGTEWHDTEAERQAIIDEFGFTQQFAEEHNIPVHVGEFGAYSTADMDSRVRWTTFMARWSEEQNYSWAYWEFSAGFGIYNPSTGQYITPLVDALLHNPMPDPTPIEYTTIFEDHFDDGLDNWQLNLFGSAQGSLTGGQGNMQVNLTNGGSEGWHVQLVKQGVPIHKDNMYRVTFTAMADGSPRNLTAYIGKNSDPWTAYSGYNGITLSTSEVLYSFTFQMMYDTDNQARLVFDLGLSDVNVIFTHVHIEQITLLTQVEEFRTHTIRAYPNPACDYLMVEDIEGYDSLFIFDLSGRKLQSHTVNDHSIRISLMNLPPGIYLVSLTGNHERQTFKIIRQ